MIEAATPLGKLGPRLSEASPPYASLRRSRTFFRPTPVPALSPPKPRPLSATVTETLPSLSRAMIQMVPPPVSGSRPCLIAFSTSVCSIIGGKAVDMRAGGTCTCTARRSPMRIFMMSRYARARSSSSASVDISPSVRGMELRR